MPWIAWTGLSLVGFVAALTALATYGRHRWTAATRVLLTGLEGAREPATSARYSTRELEGLPAPVQRYFRAVPRMANLLSPL